MHGVAEVDFAAFDRRQSRIQRHVVISFALGLLAGVLGAMTARFGPPPLEAAVNPYAFLLLSAVLGGTAAGFGWAALSALLVAVAPVVSAMTVFALVPGGSDPGVLAWGGFENATGMVTIFLSGVAGYAATRPCGRGDMAAGLFGGVLLADMVARVQDVPGFWPWPAVVIGSLVAGMVVLARRTPAACLRAVAVMPLPVAVLILFAALV